MAKDKKAKAKSKAPAPAVIKPPAWPAFRPRLPVCDLEPEALAESRVLVLRHFWPRSLCRDFVAFLGSLPLSTTPGRPKRGEAVRVNDRFQVDDPAFATRLWLETGLKDAVLDEALAHLWGGEVIGLNPNIRVYRYSKGQYFDCHYDDSNNVTLPSADGSGSGSGVPARTTWTLLLYLTSAADGCGGGETVFYPDDDGERELSVAPETGMLLLHKHGDDCMLHEGREVTAGEKWILRSDICVRK